MLYPNLPPIGDSLQFGPFRVDLIGQQVWRDGHPLALRPKLWHLLTLLVQNPGTLLSNAQLFDALWPGQDVNVKALTNLVGELRQQLGEAAPGVSHIQTVHRRGYRFTAAVHNAEGQPCAAPTEGDATPPPAPPGPGPCAPGLHGREAEQQQLHRMAAQADAGRRQTAWLAGPAGMGKSALIDALATTLAAAPPGWMVARGLCLDQRGEPEPFGPLLNLIADLACGPHGERVLLQLHRGAPCWLARMPWLMDDTAVSGRSTPATAPGRGQMLREGCALFESLAQHQPVLVAIDDLQWVDRDSADLLLQLARSQRPARLMLLLCRQAVSESTHPGSLLESAARRAAALAPEEHLHLRPLSPAAVSQWLTQHLGSLALARQLMPVLHRHTGGHPMLLKVTLDDLSARGHLRATPGGWQLTIPPERLVDELPPHLQSWVQSQLDALPPDERQLLMAASVAGSPFSIPLLAALTGEATAALETMARDLARREMFIRSAPPHRDPAGWGIRFQFDHALYQRAILQAVPWALSLRWNQQLRKRLAAGRPHRPPLGTQATSGGAAVAGANPPPPRLNRGQSGPEPSRRSVREAL